jgi:hypothetical protein
MQQIVKVALKECFLLKTVATAFVLIFIFRITLYRFVTIVILIAKNA